MNNRLKAFILIIGSQLFMSCSSHDSASGSIALSHHWTCDNGVSVDWLFEDSASTKMQLRIDDTNKHYILDKIYTTEKGTLFSNGELAFRLQEQSGLLFWANNDDIIGNHCTGN